MDDPGGVRRGEAFEQLVRDGRELLAGVSAASRADAGAQALALEELHHEVALAVGERAEIEDFDDVLGADAAGRLGLALEARHGLALFGDARVQDLDGHLAVDSGVLPLVNGTHSAFAEQADDAVLAVDDLAGTQHGRDSK